MVREDTVNISYSVFLNVGMKVRVLPGEPLLKHALSQQEKPAVGKIIHMHHCVILWTDKELLLYIIY